MRPSANEGARWHLCLGVCALLAASVDVGATPGQGARPADRPAVPRSGSAPPPREGPGPAWKATPRAGARHAEVHDVVVARKGVIAVLTSLDVFAVGEGRVLWRHSEERDERANALAYLADQECVLVLGYASTRCLSVAQGRVEWRIAHPWPRPRPDDRDTDVVDGVISDGFVALGHGYGRTVLFDSVGRMFSVSPVQCRPGARGRCLIHTGGAGRDLSGGTLRILPSGHMVLVGHMGDLRFMDPLGAPYAELSREFPGLAPGPTDVVSVTRDGAVVLAHENRVALLRPERCRASRGLRKVEECFTVLAKSRNAFDEIDSVPVPLPIGDHVVVVRGRLERWGKVSWSADLGVMGQPLLAGQRLYVLASPRPDVPPELRAVDPQSGQTVWRSVVPAADGKDPRLVDAGNGWLYVLAGGEVVAYELPAA